MKSDGFFLKVMRVQTFLRSIKLPIGRQIYVLTILSMNQTDIHSHSKTMNLSVQLFIDLYIDMDRLTVVQYCITAVCIIIGRMSWTCHMTSEKMGQKIIGSIQGHRHTRSDESSEISTDEKSTLRKGPILINNS